MSNNSTLHLLDQSFQGSLLCTSCESKLTSIAKQLQRQERQYLLRLTRSYLVSVYAVFAEVDDVKCKEAGKPGCKPGP